MSAITKGLTACRRRRWGAGTVEGSAAARPTTVDDFTKSRRLMARGLDMGISVRDCAHNISPRSKYRKRERDLPAHASRSLTSQANFNDSDPFESRSAAAAVDLEGILRLRWRLHSAVARALRAPRDAVVAIVVAIVTAAAGTFPVRVARAAITLAPVRHPAILPVLYLAETAVDARPTSVLVGLLCLTLVVAA